MTFVIRLYHAVFRVIETSALGDILTWGTFLSKRANMGGFKEGFDEDSRTAATASSEYVEADNETVRLLAPMAATGTSGEVDVCHILINSNAFLFID